MLSTVAANVHQNNAALLRAKNVSFPASKSVERPQLFSTKKGSARPAKGETRSRRRYAGDGSLFWLLCAARLTYYERPVVDCSLLLDHSTGTIE